MKRTHVLAVVMLRLAVQDVAQAADTHVHFVLGREDVGPKAIVAELLDPGHTGLGKALSYLMWREVRAAVGDQTGTDVLLLQDAAEEGLVERLRAGRHEAAVEIAQMYRAPMILWGEVQRRGAGDRARVRVQTFLTLNPEVPNADIALGLLIEQAQHATRFQAELPRTRFNFARVSKRQAELFTRRLVTLTAATLHVQPRGSAPVALQVPAGTSFEAFDMQGSWFAIRRPHGSLAYIEGHQVKVLPPRVEVTHERLELRAGPGAAYESKKQVETRGAVELLDTAYRFGHGLWYRLQVDDAEGWVASLALQPRLLFPVEHFMIGLVYYRERRFEDAYLALDRFLHSPGVKASNVNLAVAHQLQGASRLMFQAPFRFETSTDIEGFSKAVDLTPFDPAAYNLRALARFGSTRRLEGAFADLKHALDLDPLNYRARTFVRTLVDVAARGAFGLPRLDWLETFLHVERIREAPYMRMSQTASAIGPSGAGEGVLMTVENHTKSGLNVYFYGKAARTVAVQAGQSAAVDLAAGEYAIAVEFAPDRQGKMPQIRPMYGEQAYAPQTHYVLKFYVQWLSGS